MVQHIANIAAFERHRIAITLTEEKQQVCY